MNHNINLAPSIIFLVPGRMRKAKFYARGRRRAEPITLFNPPGAKKIIEGAK